MKITVSEVATAARGVKIIKNRHMPCPVCQGTDNTTSATIETLESSRERAAVIGFSFTTPEPTSLYMGNASIRPLQPRRYLYHAYLEANGYKNPLSMKMFSLSLESIMREYGHHYLKRRKKLGVQANLDLTEESSSDWLPKCDAA